MTRGLERWLLLLVLSIGWGSSYLFQDEAVGELEPLAVSAVRLAVAAAIVYGALRLQGQRLPREARLWLFFFAIGLIGNLLPFTLITWAQEGVKSSVAGILTAVVPLITLMLAHFFGDEALSWRRVLGFLLGFAGVVALFGPQAVEEGFATGQLLPYGALFAGAVCFAATAVIAARMPTVQPMAATAGVLIAAAVLTVPAALLFSGGLPERPTLDAIGSLAVLAVIITPWATYAYFRLVRLSGPAFLSLFNYFNPLVAVAGGVLILGERLPSTAALALGLILGGIAVSEYRRIAKAVDAVLAP